MPQIQRENILKRPIVELLPLLFADRQDTGNAVRLFVLHLLCIMYILCTPITFFLVLNNSTLWQSFKYAKNHWWHEKPKFFIIAVFISIRSLQRQIKPYCKYYINLLYCYLYVYQMGFLVHCFFKFTVKQIYTLSMDRRTTSSANWNQLKKVVQVVQISTSQFVATMTFINN